MLHACEAPKIIIIELLKTDNWRSSDVEAVTKYSVD